MLLRITKDCFGATPLQRCEATARLSNQRETRALPGRGEQA